MSGSSKKSNIALLTEGQAYIQRAKKARKEQVEEIKFDDEARRSVQCGMPVCRCGVMWC
jgi:ribosomal RNA-processing protein 17